VSRWFQRITGFSVQLVYSDSYLHEDFQLGLLDYSKEGLVALWAVLEHPKGTHTSTGDFQERKTTLPTQLIPVLSAHLSNQDQSRAAYAKSSPGSEKKPHFKYPEAFPTPPAVNDTAWNKIYTAANARMYYNSGKSVAIAKANRTSGETYQLALSMLAKKQAKIPDQKKPSSGSKNDAHQASIRSGHSYVADRPAVILGSAYQYPGIEELGATEQSEKKNPPRKEASEGMLKREFNHSPKTTIMQQASAFLEPSKRSSTSGPRAATLVEKDPALKMLTTEASIDSSLKDLTERVAKGVASEDEQMQFQTRYYEHLAEVRDAHHADRSVTTRHSTSSPRLRTLGSPEVDEPVCGEIFLARTYSWLIKYRYVRDLEKRIELQNQ